MDLTTLSEHLKTQATNNNSIVLDQTFLSSDQLKQISLSFILGDDKNLTIEGVTPSDIPAPQDDSLTIEVGTSSLLNQKSVPTKLVFTINDNKAQVLIEAKMSASWVFKDSFPDLVQFPFSNFTLTDSCFIYAPAQQLSYQPWSDKPQETIKLEAGLNFAAWLTLDGFSTILTLLADIIGADTSYKFFGPFTPTADAKYPVGKLSSLLSTKDFSIGYAPLLLTVSHPTFVTQISKPENSIQNIDLDLQAMSSLGLDFSLGISSTGDSLTFGATPIAGEPFTADKIMQMPGGGDFQSFIPSELENIFKEVGLKYFTLVMLTKTQKVGYMEFSIGTVEPWDVLPDVIKLENMVLMLNMSNPSGTNSLTAVSLVATAQILPNLFKGDFTFAINIQKANQRQWQVTSIRGQYIGIIKLGDIVKDILGSVTSVPPELNDVSFSDFGVSVDKTNNSYVCYGNCECSLPLLGSEVNSTLSINVNYSSNAYTVVLTGVLSIREQIFGLELDFSKQQGAQDIKLTASWKAQDNAYLEFEDIASAFNLEVPKIPEGLDLALQSASLTYDFTNKNLVIEANSANLGEAVFVAFKSNTTTKYQFCFGLTVSQRINLSNLPLVGKEFPPEQTISVNDLQLLIASADFTSQEITTINNLIPDNFTKIPERSTTDNQTTVALPKGLNVDAKMQFGGTTDALALPVSAATPPTSPNPPTPSPTTTNNTTSNSAIWFKLQKSFGPVHFEKVGVQYKDAAIWFLLDTALSAAGLTLSLEGLSLGSSFSKFEPKFNLHGLGLDYKSGPIEIGGAFLKGKIAFEGKEYDDYSGTAVIRTKALTLAAIGSYVQLDIGPSMFIYAVLNIPIPIDPSFVITGFSGGFGYNRRLIPPDITQVSTFPLVEEAITGDSPTDKLDTPDQELIKLANYIQPSTSQIFIAAGIKFTTYKLIDSFALLILQFGQRFEIDILGLSTVLLPPVRLPDIEPLAEVQLALKATFVLDEGVLSFEAQLTSNSYILSKACHLTGGFAFFCWFKDNPLSGAKAGDLVVSLGGYHPKYIVPKHYPIVPRLGMSWQVSKSGDSFDLSIKGGAYFALTAQALMVGGALEANWSSGPFKAWFKVSADFIISWQPYYYDANFYAHLGASYTFNIFGSNTITVELGGNIHLWGPEFSGIATINLYIISLDVKFGSPTSQKIKPIDWQTFKDSFLPKDDQICSITVQKGLIRQVKETVNEKKIDRWVVNPKELVFATNSVIPIKEYSCLSSNDENSQPNKDWGIAPMGIESEQVRTIHTIKIVRNGEDQPEGKDHFKFTPILKAVPAGLWGQANITKDKDKKYLNSPNLNGKQFVENTLAGFTITANNPIKKLEHTELLDPSTLEYQTELISDAYSWEEFNLTGDQGQKAWENAQNHENPITNKPKRTELLSDWDSLITILTLDNPSTKTY